MYGASNGITPPVDVSDEEARAVFVRTDPRLRRGSYELGFEIYVAGEYGHALPLGITFYRPVKEATS